MQKDYLLIGLDGGATKVSGWSIEVESNNTFSLGEYNATKAYAEYPEYIEDYKAVDIKKQLDEFEKGSIRLTKKEKKQARVYVEAAFAVVKKLVDKSGVSRVLIGEGMPGLKTRDERGISVMSNGPRIVDYCDILENKLGQENIELVAPMAKLGSDAFYCGIGEEYAKEGEFRNSENGYYLGGGTGAADALKLEGELVSLDDIKDWFVKTWELESDGLKIEKCASAQGIQSIYADQIDTTINQLNEKEIYPIQIRKKAVQGDKAAQKTYQVVMKGLAKLMYERIVTLYSGWKDIFDFVDPDRDVPRDSHDYMNTLLDSIILGQRLGELFDEAEEDEIVWEPFLQHLSEFIMESEYLPEKARQHYCPGGKFDKDIIDISKLREAPALGAGIDAFLNYKR